MRTLAREIPAMDDNAFVAACKGSPIKRATVGVLSRSRNRARAVTRRQGDDVRIDVVASRVSRDRLRRPRLARDSSKSRGVQHARHGPVTH